MNSSTYIFGNFGHSYTQYPYDDAKDFFLHGVSCSKEEKQLIVHRDVNIIYYVYVQFLNSRHSLYIGLSLVFNNLMVTDYSSLFHLFEEGVRMLAVEGEILTYRGNDIVPNVKTLGEKGTEARILESYFSSKLSEMSHIMTSLDAFDYSRSSNTVKRSSLSMSSERLQEYANRYDYTIMTNASQAEEETSEIELILNLEGKKKKENNFIDDIIIKIKDLCK